MKEYNLTIAVLIVMLMIGCKNENLKGFYKFYQGDPIGDALYFEQQKHYLVNDTIFFNEVPIGILVSAKRRLVGERFITVREFSSNRRAVYIKK